MSVDVINETEWVIDPRMFSDLAVWTMDQMMVSTQCDMTIIFNDPESMATLHEEWMDLKGPTDVMSFPMDELHPGDGTTIPEGVLGDIVLCPYVASVQAQAAGHPVIEELMLLTVHGMLHLLGYDHTTHEEENVMFAIQRRIYITFMSRRPGIVQEVYLPQGAPDLLAEYSEAHKNDE